MFSLLSQSFSSPFFAAKTDRPPLPRKIKSHEAESSLLGREPSWLDLQNRVFKIALIGGFYHRIISIYLFFYHRHGRLSIGKRPHGPCNLARKRHVSVNRKLFRFFIDNPEKTITITPKGV
jgi:hypothetical protein